MTPPRAHVLALTAAAATVALAPIVGVHATGHPTGHPSTIRYLSTNPQNTDLNLDNSQPELSPGDVEVFVNDAVRGGRMIGHEYGECRVVEVTYVGEEANGLKAACHSTLVLANGTITSQGVFIEDDFATGPTNLTNAVTGGTGAYRGATGEVTGQFIPNTDTVRITIRLT